MKKAVITIDKILYQILADDQFDNFRVIQLRDLYITLSTERKSSEDTYQYLYRQINKLIKNKIIEKNGKGKRVLYSKTKRFSETDFTISKDKVHIHDFTTDDSISILQARLNKFENDLLSNIGESEEYKKLYISLPQLQDYLEPKYLFTIKNHLKILGKIKAVKSVILHTQSCSNVGSKLS